MVIEENLVFLREDEPKRLFFFIIDSLKLVNKSLETLNLINDTLYILVNTDTTVQTTSTQSPIIEDQTISVYRNPITNQALIITNPNTILKKYVLYGVEGKPLDQGIVDPVQKVHQLYPFKDSRFPQGTYWLKLIGDRGVLTRKILVVDP